MRIVLGFLVSLLFAASFCHGDHVEVVGVAECADCAETNFKPTHAVKGLKVNIDCKAPNGENFKTRGFGELDGEGNFKVSLPEELVEGGKLKEECYAQLQSASATPCPAHDGLDSTKLVLIKSRSSEDGHKQYVLGVSGKLRFSPTLCASAFFWHHYYKHPPLPKVTIPPYHHHPLPKVTFPPYHHHPLPKIFPPFHKKPYPPPVPVVSHPPPVPVVTHPPPVPVVTHPPPVPVVTKPHPPPVPVYKKPHPPPVPVYKKPHPPPVPVYKKPHPPPVPTKKPCPPVPKIPPIPKIPKKTYPPIPKIPKIPPVPKIPKIPKKPCPPPKFFHHPKFGKFPPPSPHHL